MDNWVNVAILVLLLVWMGMERSNVYFRKGHDD